MMTDRMALDAERVLQAMAPLINAMEDVPSDAHASVHKHLCNTRDALAKLLYATTTGKQRTAVHRRIVQELALVDDLPEFSSAPVQP